ncbi:MAG: hypothetical protein EOO13_09155 [Chitinophagaceae bacterium]|nr:MAG: hypothetical protein EOO13_09155 [Chitinophagaceae bacterium]
MKRITILATLILLSLAAAAQADNAACLSFHTGTFAYRNDSLGIIQITRTKNRQEELNEKTRVLTKFKITWVDACTYTLKQIWSNSKKQRKQNNSLNTIIITAATKDSYQFSCSCTNDPGGKNNSGTVVRIFY